MRPKRGSRRERERGAGGIASTVYRLAAFSLCLLIRPRLVVRPCCTELLDQPVGVVPENFVRLDCTSKRVCWVEGGKGDEDVRDNQAVKRGGRAGIEANEGQSR